jgi:hypothetical protein
VGGFLVPGEQVKRMFLGNTVYYTWLATYRGVSRGATSAAYHRDERHVVSVSRYGNGKPAALLWWMEGDARCTEQIDSHVPICRLIYELKDMTVQCIREEDICPIMIRVVPGNAENL